MKKAKKDSRICVVLPALDEAENIGWMIDEIRKYCDYPIIVVDEQSKDGTADIAREKGAEVFQRQKRGYGEGVKTGMRIAKEKGFTYMVLLDCDRTYPPKYIPELVKEIEDYDIIMGVRPMKDIMWEHRYANMFLNVCINVMFGGKMKDINTGMKVLNVNKYLPLLDGEGMDLTPQISCVTLKQNYRVKQIPIEYHDRKYDQTKGTAKIRYADGFVLLGRIIVERFRK